MAAVEIYNKPTFAYREEAFSILALNAWELLLKAKLLSEASNSAKALWVYEHRQLAGGGKSRKRYLKKNRAGNPYTLGLGPVIVDLEARGTNVPQAVRSNLDALIEIRDNAVHFINASPRLAKQVLEIGTAAVKNFIELGGSWFGLDLAGAQIYLMPIGFVGPVGVGTVLSLQQDENRLLTFLSSLVARGANEEGGSCHAALEVSLSFKRTGAVGTPVLVTNDPTATNVTLSEEDIRKRFPWSYADLLGRLKKRFVDFKENPKFHGLKRQLMLDANLVKSRYLDPGNLRSSKKDFYSPNALSFFDLHYTKK